MMNLKTAYEPYFKIGVAAPEFAFSNEKMKQELLSQYNSFTCENEMKPEIFLDEQTNTSDPGKYDLCPAVHMDSIRPIMEFARANGIQMRGHTLVWHSQTPFWFFKKGYSKEKEAPLVDRETMLARMEGYIRQVLTFFKEEYPGIIYAWDVLNEGVNDGDLRKSLWSEIIGEDYIQYAFRFARKYCEPGVALFYNDYTTYEEWKMNIICEKVLKPLAAEGLIDGMGMQSHLLMDEPDMKQYEKAVHTYGAFGLELQITELDIHNADPSEESMTALAERYHTLFTILLNAKKAGKANVTSVTLWGMNDDMTWLSGFRREKSYPLLFDGQFQPKKAYDAVIRAAQEA